MYFSLIYNNSDVNSAWTGLIPSNKEAIYFCPSQRLHGSWFYFRFLICWLVLLIFRSILSTLFIRESRESS